MPAKIIILSQKDQDLLRVLLNQAMERTGKQGVDDTQSGRINDLKERIGL